MAIGISPNATSRILADLSAKAQSNAPKQPAVDDLEWIDYDASSLPDDLQTMYADRAAAMRLARELEDKFETALNDRLRQHKLIAGDETMLASYRFGKLRCAVAKTATLQRKTAAKSANVFGFKR